MPSPWLLVLCHEFPPAGGGCGRNLRLLCRELSQRGLRLEVWTVGLAATESESFAVKRFDVGRKARFETNTFGLLRFIRLALQAGRKVHEPPSAIFSAMGFPAGAAGAWLSRKWNVPHYVWYHGTDAHGGKPQGPGFGLRVYLGWLFRRSRGSFFVSRDLSDLAGKAGMPPRPRLLPSTPAPEFRAGPGADLEPAYFLWAGRLEPVKRPLLAVEAFEWLRHRGALPPFRMAGEGSLQGEVAQALRRMGASELEPPLAEENMPRALGGALAVLVTSRVEGFSTLILEAASLGVPAIACDAPGLREFIRHGENGLLVQEGDPEALAHAILQVWRDPDLRDRLGQAAQRDAEGYTPKANAEALLRAFAEDGLAFSPPAERRP